jgi:hypothetical protein
MPVRPNRVCDGTSALGHVVSKVIVLVVIEVSVKKAGQWLHEPET